MHFDDRLATVLRHRAAGERAARTQFRQLLDLLGAKINSGGPKRDDSLMASAWLRLGALGEIVPVSERAAMIRESGLRFRNAELAAHLAEDEPDVAAAALAKADLTDDDWEALIPRLPIRARGFLRLRRDLSPATMAILDRLGIQDRGLPHPAPQIADKTALTARSVSGPTQGTIPPSQPARPIAANDEAPDIAGDEDSAIGVLVKRIEAFRKARVEPAPSHEAPLLPMSGLAADAERKPVSGFSFTTDTSGRVDWASNTVAPAIIGQLIANSPLRPELAKAMQQRQPIRGVKLTLDGSPMIVGDWTVTANPRFTAPDGRFFGYAGMIRRSVASEQQSPENAQSSEADRLRQLLHELRTPVNAIQGFSEVIQQQLFGPTPHEYRALAANIAGDSARMLAGFDELDRLARLETGAMEIAKGECDFGAIVAQQLDQLQTVLKSRSTSFEFAHQETPNVAMAPAEAEAMAWRLLATLAAATGASEHLQIELTEERSATLQLACELPFSLAAKDDIFSSSAKPQSGALSSGMFGAGFSFRLVRAEARACGGELKRVDDWLMLNVPLLTADQSAPSQNLSG